ncbi:T9SS type B sorting domain-containing protein, partial [Seonamhaeicola maritimus]
ANESVITRTWSLNDGCDNITTHVQTITVIDTKGPELITQFPGSVSATCDAIPDAPEPTFSDNCSPAESIQVEFTETTSYIQGSTEEYEIKRSWLVTDECGNESGFEQIVTVTIDEFVSNLTTDACVDDGTIDLNDFVNDLDNSSWTFVSGVGTPSLEGSIFDPSNLLDFLGDYVFSYTYTSPTGCLETTNVTININDDCVVYPCTSDDIIISKAVTPNGDFYNQSFNILSDPGCGFIAEVKIFNRWGALIYQSTNYPLDESDPMTGSSNPNKWEGQANGSVGNADTAPNGTYYYIITLKNSDGSGLAGLPPFTGPVYLGTK